MKSLIPILVATAGLVAVASPAVAGNHADNSVEITNGRFQNLTKAGDAVHYDVKGGAIMFRTANETTVYVKVKGLEPGTFYPTHVHNQLCSWSPPGGSHYQEDVLGPVDRFNEMWPGFMTDDTGQGVGSATHAFRARPEAQSLVIHYPAMTSIRLACVDLT
ncbi:MAG: hypothetical protein ABIP17_07595 [Ilumatobacteraceae bacterium]